MPDETPTHRSDQDPPVPTPPPAPQGRSPGPEAGPPPAARTAPEPKEARPPVGDDTAAGPEQPATADAPDEPDDPGLDLSANERLIVDSVQVLNLYVSDHRSGGVFVSGGSVTAETVSGRDVRGGRRGTASDPTRTRVQLVGVSAASPDERQRLQAVTVTVAAHERAATLLRQDRFVVLSGPSGHGKRAAAVALLQDQPSVLDIDPSISLKSLAQFDTQVLREEARGYVVETLTAETARRLNDFTARTLTQQLEKAGAYLVLTVDHRVPLAPEMDERTVVWRERPETAEVMRRHLRFYLSAPEPVADLDAVVEKLLGDLIDLNVAQHLSERELRLSDRVARQVVAAHRKGTSIEQAVRDLGLDARRRVEEWFAQDPGLPELAFLLAATVLGGCTYATVSHHAARLEQVLAEVTRTDLSEQPQPPNRTRSGRLSSCLATLEDGLLNTEFGPYLAKTVALESNGLVPAVLDIVWHEYDLVAEALMRWLLETGGDPRSPTIQIRVACAAGQLAQYDFATIRSRLLLPWAKDGPRQPGGSTAAYALGVPAASEETAALVLGLLRHWSRLANADMAWTAAAAFGGYVGLIYPHLAMNELLEILLRNPGNHRLIVSAGVQQLFLFGGQDNPAVATMVLAGLHEWGYWEGTAAAKVSRTVFLRFLQTAGTSSSSDSGQVWTQLTAPDALAYSARLLAGCFASRATRIAAFEAVRDLLVRADSDERLYPTLEVLILDAIGPDRSNPLPAQRVAHYLDQFSQGDDASPSAARLLQTVRKDIPV